MGEVVFALVDPAHLTRRALEAKIAKLSDMLSPQAGYGPEMRHKICEYRAQLIAELDAREAADDLRKRDGWPIVVSDRSQDHRPRPSPADDHSASAWWGILIFWLAMVFLVGFIALAGVSLVMFIDLALTYAGYD